MIPSPIMAIFSIKSLLLQTTIFTQKTADATPTRIWNLRFLAKEQIIGESSKATRSLTATRRLMLPFDPNVVDAS